MINIKKKRATRAPTLKFNKILPKSKRSQEEMVGFALIIIIVAVIVLVFITLGLRSKAVEETKSSEIYNFLQSSLTYTSRCATEYVPDYSTVERLIDDCYSGEICVNLNEENACLVLKDTLENMLEANWLVGEASDVKGYSYEIYVQETNLVNITKGIITRNYKVPDQPLTSGVDIIFKVYF